MTTETSSPVPGVAARRWQRLGALLVLVASTLACDQGTKVWATRALSGAAPRTLLGGGVELRLAHNRGAFLSLGDSLPEHWRTALLTGVVGLALVGMLLVSMRTAWRGGAWLGLAAMAGAGLSNWVDRVRFDGQVTDFVLLRAGPLHTGIFNWADVVVMGAAVLVVVQANRHPPADSPPNAPPPTLQSG
jgi:signal peptidase II